MFFFFFNLHLTLIHLKTICERYGGILIFQIGRCHTLSKSKPGRVFPFLKVRSAVNPPTTASTALQECWASQVRNIHLTMRKSCCEAAPWGTLSGALDWCYLEVRHTLIGNYCSGNYETCDFRSFCFSFAGPETKLMQNCGKSTFKRTSIDRLMNILVLFVSAFVLSHLRVINNLLFFNEICEEMSWLLLRYWSLSLQLNQFITLFPFC